MDKSGANKALLDPLNAEPDISIKVWRGMYPNNIVEPDHRAFKPITRPNLGFKPVQVAQAVVTGIELMHMIRKGQVNMAGCNGISFANQFYVLAGQVHSK